MRPKTKKKSAAKTSRNDEEALLDLLACLRFREDDARHERADRPGKRELLGDRSHADDEADDREEEELAREPREQAVDRAYEEACRREGSGQEQQCLERNP